jgi:hypothetical protein
MEDKDKEFKPAFSLHTASDALKWNGESFKRLLIKILNNLIFIFVYLFISLLFGWAFFDFAHFRDVEAMSFILKNFSKLLADPIANPNPEMGQRLQILMYWVHCGKYLGLVIGVICSLIISVRKKLFKLNALFILILGYVIVIPLRLDSFLRFLDIDYLFYFKDWEVPVIINGCLLLILGIAGLWMADKNILKWRFSYKSLNEIKK